MAERKIVEVMAGAMATRDDSPSVYAYKHYARDALAALEAAGFVVVPKEPTEAMLVAARGSRPYVEDGGNDDEYCDRNSELTYAAMLLAASKENDND